MMTAFRFQRTLLLAFFLLFAGGAWAQSNLVGVNTRTPTEALDVNGTFRVRTLPQVNDRFYNGFVTPLGGTLFQQSALVVADKNGVLGQSTGTIERFFYMPPILLPLHNYVAAPDEKSDANGVFRINLYNHYIKQFDMQDPTTSTCSPNGASMTYRLPRRPQYVLDFYVTYYDPEVFKTISIDDDGILTYTVHSGCSPTERTFVNVIFGLKP